MTGHAWLATSVVAAIRAEARRYPDAETGGVLLGYWAGANVVIVDVIGPGPDATRTANTFHPDPMWQDREIARRYAASGRCHSYLGDWHVHPGGSTLPSRTDRRTLAAIARHPAARASRPLFAIIAPDADGDLDVWCFVARWRQPRRLLVTLYEPGLLV